MKHPIVVVLLVMALLASVAVGYRQYENTHGFTPWMSLNELNMFMKTFEAPHPGEPNYWDKGHWMTAVNGRWHDGIPQYRIRYGEAPKRLSKK